VGKVSTLVILAALVAAGYFGYQRVLSPKAKAGGGAESGRVLETNNPAFYGTMENGQPVLRMKPETSADLARIAPGRVVMFATSWCPYCKKVREIFAAQGVRYTELDVEMDSRAADYQKATFGSTGVPILVIGNRVTMGFDEGEIMKGLKEI
jgi:glutaredoxin